MPGLVEKVIIIKNIKQTKNHHNMCMSCARSGGGVISRAKVRSVQLTMVKKNLQDIDKKKKIFS